MYSGRIFRLAVAGVVVAAGLGPATPATASVRYDPVAKTGFADARDVRKAFGWSDTKLAARAGGLVFGHDFWTNDVYSVSCGQGQFPVAHQRDYGRYELTGVVVRAKRREAGTGYGEKSRLAGFRITGPYAGVSGTTVAPAVGQPCPEARGPRITRADLVSTAAGWSLTVSSGTTSKVLRSGR